MSNITKCDKRQSGLFLFLKEGRDSHVADILLKRKNKTNGGNTMNNKLIINTNLLRKESVTPYSVGRCHEVTEGTGDCWESLSLIHI